MEGIIQDLVLFKVHCAQLTLSLALIPLTSFLKECPVLQSVSVSTHGVKKDSLIYSFSFYCLRYRFYHIIFPQSWITLKWKNAGWNFTPGSTVLFTKFAIFETFTNIFRVLSQTVLFCLVTTNLEVEALKHIFTIKNCDCHLLLLFKDTLGWPATTLHADSFGLKKECLCVWSFVFKGAKVILGNGKKKWK